MINEKIRSIQQVLADLKESGANQTKSTAGDKHETALAMLQIEQANSRKQLQEIQEQKAILEKIDPALLTVKVVNGSLVKTNRGYFYISIALGKMMVDETTVIALSQHSPLGKQLMGAVVGDMVSFNNNNFTIEDLE